MSFYVIFCMLWLERMWLFEYKQKCLKVLNPEKADVAVRWTGLSIVVTKCKKCSCVFYEYWHPMTCDNFRIGIWNQIWEEYAHVQSYREKNWKGFFIVQSFIPVTNARHVHLATLQWMFPLNTDENYTLLRK